MFPAAKDANCSSALGLDNVHVICKHVQTAKFSQGICRGLYTRAYSAQNIYALVRETSSLLCKINCCSLLPIEVFVLKFGRAASGIIRILSSNGIRGPQTTSV